MASSTDKAGGKAAANQPLPLPPRPKSAPTTPVKLPKYSHLRDRLGHD